MHATQHKPSTHTCQELCAGKRVLVVGLGKTGLSVVRFLQQRGVLFAVADSRLQPPGLKVMHEAFPDVPLFLGEFDPQVFAQVDMLIVSPGVAVAHPVIAEAAQRGAQVIGDIEIFAQCVRKPVIAITGSNGKSTVTSLVAAMVQQAGFSVGAGANLGIPALDLLPQDPQYYVLELSSFQLETTLHLDPQASVILNISEDHMDRYSSLQEYARAKARIYRGTGIVVCNDDDIYVSAFTRELPAQRKVLHFSLAAPVKNSDFGVLRLADGDWIAQGKHPLLAVNAMKITGQHNVANALAALALGCAVNLPMEAMLRALQQFPGLPHRSQWIIEKAGVTWYNDSKGTNVGAALAAITGIPATKLIVILGGQGKGQDFSALRAPLQQRARHVMLLGQDAGLIAEAIKDAVPITRVKSLDDAILQSQRLAEPGDAVLLSPACASFDMFSGYEQRGEIFMQRVRELLA
ncbi:MAG: UDP-N-acetylmuramoyl-L-alanine--D-glutamate ligase [Gammaproteobacteria bacterium]|nr:UDP-N-acetylmuramoyl-L-alanine--D-glutamate ligase [Gammaproteobacteria bacterium]